MSCLAVHHIKLDYTGFWRGKKAWTKKQTNQPTNEKQQSGQTRTSIHAQGSGTLVSRNELEKQCLANHCTANFWSRFFITLSFSFLPSTRKSPQLVIIHVLPAVLFKMSNSTTLCIHCADNKVCKIKVIIILSLQRGNTRTSDDMGKALLGCFWGQYLGTLLGDENDRKLRITFNYN